ncbi:MAG: uroporphyrinogen-III C-methyltransferase [Acidobacteria bacterium]|nr:uroporphyrinogen-III C-methyltransferase [Acidobacteriota bacterium]
MTGKVYLVGAGPGDPELLTLKALRVLNTADVILHDDLVSADILQLAPPAAQVLNVGKRCGNQAIRQEEISELMVGFARSGHTVVRLKGGDPLIFGRAGEEMEALRVSGIELEVVPGITAATAAAASAGVSLTDRRFGASVVLVTGHRLGGLPPDDWRSLASSKAMVAIYMPGKDFGRLSHDLIAAGWDGDTPCLATSRASTPGERRHLTTLRNLAETPQTTPPCILLVGAGVSAVTSDSDDTDAPAKVLLMAGA